MFRHLLFFLTICCLVFMGSPAQAHWADMAAMELNISSQSAEGIFTLPTPFISEADKNKDGQVSSEEIKNSSKKIASILEKSIYIKGNYHKGLLSVYPATQLNTSLSNRKNFSSLLLKWTWESPVSNYTMHYSLFPQDAPKAHCLVSVNLNHKISSLVFNHQTTDHPLQETSTGFKIKTFTTLGFEHILTGYDHILFLLALLLVGGRFMYLLKIVTAFTIAHSVTLTLAVLNLVNAPGRIIESIIAASIIYVAAENLWRKEEREPHWMLVFIFGLIHGLGFANILKEMALSSQELVTALISFNIGIEVGQVCIVLIAWYLLSNLAKAQWYNRFKYAGSVAIIIMASIWFVERAILGA